MHMSHEFMCEGIVGEGEEGGQPARASLPASNVASQRTRTKAALQIQLERFNRLLSACKQIKSKHDASTLVV